MESRFSSSLFVGKVVSSGSKTSGSAFPTLTANSTKDKFTLNKKALALMSLDEESLIVMIDMNKGEAVESDHNKRWFLTPGFEKAPGQMEGAKIGKGGTFSYAGIYSAIIMDQPDISEATTRDIVNAGKGIFRTTPAEKEAFIGLQKVQFRVERVVDENGNELFEIAPGVIQKVYALTEYTVIPHDPKAPAEEGAEEEVTDGGKLPE